MRKNTWVKANLEKDMYFLDLVERGLLVVYKSGKVVNPKTGNVLADKSIPSLGGYHHVSWREGTKTRSIYKQRLIWLSFRGPIPKGMQVNHKDGNKSNNRLSNFELSTNQQNVEHSYRVLGNKAISGPAHPCSKLTEKQVRFIRRKAKVVSQRSLARRFGLSPSSLSSIVLRKTYKNIA